MSPPSDSNRTGTAEINGPRKSDFWKLTLGSIGVVYGDIGTSPLYAFKESLSSASAGAHAEPNTIIGVVSLILWALMSIVTLKYVIFLLRADNHGEGGTLTLMALAQRGWQGNAYIIAVMGMLGAALFYGDAVITPAISVLSAVEGLKIITPAFEPYIIPLSLMILVGLFVVQKRGTAKVATFFGPITAVWFVALAVGGSIHIVTRPDILTAANPAYAVQFLLTHGHIGFLTLGSVFLAVTGAEALYADLGHFGRGPIQFAWIAVVFPALAINYLGQGAMVLANPDSAESPFFLLYPGWAQLPMVLLATAATVIASQAVISGAYSLTQQAIQLGLLPRFQIRRTSETQTGQIYIPRINWMMLVMVLLLVLMFRTSSALAAAYGIAVTGTMVVTSVMAFIVVWRCWNWPLGGAALLIVPMLFVDSVFLIANLAKVVEGGWLPLVIAAFLIMAMLAWREGTSVLAEKTRRTDVSLSDLLNSLERRPRDQRVAGTAVFLTAHPQTAPTALLHNMKHNKVLHENNIILSVLTADRPYMPEEERVSLKPLSDTFMQVTLRFGYMENPNVTKALPVCREHGWKMDVMQTSFFLSRRALKPSPDSPLPKWENYLFIQLARFGDDAASYFSLPTDRVVEIGTQITV
jgi:KUP system potassium uptake protein